MLVMRPVDPVTYDEAAAILGLDMTSVIRLVAAEELQRDGALSRADVEAVAIQTWSWMRAAEHPDPHSYWVTGAAAAAVLGVNRARLGQLADAGRLPYVVHRDGSTRMFRRHQLEVIRRARTTRWPPRPESLDNHL